jgi:hypothetical protein
MVVLGALLASLYAAIFHFMKGKTLGELPIFWAASLLGFATGQVAAYSLKTSLLMIGELHLLEASILSVGFLWIVRWLKM